MNFINKIKIVKVNFFFNFINANDLNIHYRKSKSHIIKEIGRVFIQHSFYYFYFFFMRLKSFQLINRRFIFDIPDHNNFGDSLIWYIYKLFSQLNFFN